MSSQTPTSIFVTTGQFFDIINPDPAEVKAWDIAWALAGINRWAAHTPERWDVLSHTGLMYSLATQDLKGNLTPIEKLSILLHDAHEAYTGDVSRPLRRAIPEYTAICERVSDAIYARFGVKYWVEETFWGRYDDQALWVERQSLFSHVKEESCIRPVYRMDTLPKLAKAKPMDYILLLREIAINIGVPGINELFEFPEHLEPYLNAPTAVQQAVRVTQALPPLKNDLSQELVPVVPVKDSRTEEEIRQELSNMAMPARGTDQRESLYGMGT